MKQLLFISLIFSSALSLFGQSGLEIGGYYSPTYSILNDSETKREGYAYRYGNSFGIDVKKDFNKFYLQSGIQLLTQGTNISSNEIGIKEGENYFLNQSLNIPLNVGYYILNTNKVSLGVQTGVLAGFFTKEYYQHPAFYPIDVEMFEYYLGANAAMDFRFKLNSKVSLNIVPNVNYQFNASNISTGDVRLISYGLNLGLSYKFNNKM